MENDCALRCWEGNGVQLCQSTRHGNDVTPGVVGIGVGGIGVPGCHRCRLRCLSRGRKRLRCYPRCHRYSHIFLTAFGFIIPLYMDSSRVF